VTAAQPKVIERASIARGVTQFNNSPVSLHHADRAPGMSLNPSPPRFGHTDSGLSADLMNLSTSMPMAMESLDVAWSPALADEIGWDWGDFLPLFSEPPI